MDAELIHEAAIGKIAGEQILKLRTLGLTEEEAEEKEAIKNDEDCKKSGAGFGPEKRNGTKKSRHGTVDSFRWILGRGRIGVPAGGKTVHRALYRSVFPAGSTNVHCAVSVA